MCDREYMMTNFVGTVKHIDLHLCYLEKKYYNGIIDTKLKAKVMIKKQRSKLT